MTSGSLTASEFLGTLDALRHRYSPKQIPTRDIFELAKQHIGMEPVEIEALLEDDSHEARVGAVSIMDWQARARNTTARRRKDLFDLYMRRHDRIDSWDLVDRSAP